MPRKHWLRVRARQPALWRRAKRDSRPPQLWTHRVGGVANPDRAATPRFSEYHIAITRASQLFGTRSICASNSAAGPVFANFVFPRRDALFPPHLHGSQRQAPEETDAMLARRPVPADARPAARRPCAARGRSAATVAHRSGAADPGHKHHSAPHGYRVLRWTVLLLLARNFDAAPSAATIKSKGP